MEQFAALVNASEMPFSKVKEFLEEKLPEIEPNDLSNKVAIVTGGNTGIGYEAAKAIASMNAKKIILACRNEEKSSAAIQKIKEETKYKGEIEAWKLDLASFKSVKEFSEKFLATKLPLDILVSNAGLVSSSPWEETAEGLEITQQVNHLANALLISNLYPALKQAATENKEEIKNKFPRVVVVASDVHYWALSPQPDDPTPVQTTLKKPEHSNQLLTYSISKLYNILFAQAFARKCPDNIWICSCSPGYTVSELGTKDGATGKANGTPRHNLLPARPTYEGAKTIIRTAISPKVGDSGKYYSEVRESPTRSSTTGESGVKFSENLWNDTVTVLKKYSPSSPIYDW